MSMPSNQRHGSSADRFVALVPCISDIDNGQVYILFSDRWKHLSFWRAVFSARTVSLRKKSSILRSI
jgi:hypothetical protein